MPQEYKDDQHHRDDHFKNRLLGIADGVVDKLRAIVDGNDLYARGQRRLNLLEARLHPIDHVESVLAAAHDHDAGNHFALAVEIGNAPAEIRTGDHLTHILDAHRRTRFGAGHHDVLEVVDGSRIPAAAYHVLSAAEVQQPRAGFAVPLPDRVHHLADGKSVTL